MYRKHGKVFTHLNTGYNIFHCIFVYFLVSKQINLRLQIEKKTNSICQVQTIQLYINLLCRVIKQPKLFMRSDLSSYMSQLNCQNHTTERRRFAPIVILTYGRLQTHWMIITFLLPNFYFSTGLYPFVSSHKLIYYSRAVLLFANHANRGDLRS